MLGLSTLTVGLLLAAFADAQLTLGSASSFSVLGASTVTSTGLTVLTGDVGVSPGTAITGFPPGVFTGTLHSADAVALAAQADAHTAYNAAAGLAPTQSLTGQDLGGLTLGPGVYNFASSGGLTGVLTLDAGGNANAQFVFQFGSTITTATASQVVLINGAKPCNVFWQVGSSATLGTGTMFAGNVIALASVTANSNVMAQGGLFALNAAVTMINDQITSQGTCGAAVIVLQPTTSSTTTTLATSTTPLAPATTATTTTTVIVTVTAPTSPASTVTVTNTALSSTTSTVTVTTGTTSTVTATSTVTSTQTTTKTASTPSCTATIVSRNAIEERGDKKSTKTATSTKTMKAAAARTTTVTCAPAKQTKTEKV
ncbi:hypothetical protein B0A49_11222, partial [Cryomyces minteri]